MKSELQTLQSQTFPTLESNITTFYGSPEPTTKLGALGNIVSQIPSIIQSFILMSANMFKTKRALRR